VRYRNLLILAVLAMSFQASAEFISLDWKVAGDDRAFLQEETGIEWLKLTETVNMSINQVESELVAGGLYEGWRLPDLSEVDGIFNDVLATSPAFESQSQMTTSAVRDVVSDWVDLFGSTWAADINGDAERSYGLLKKDTDASMFGGFFFFQGNTGNANYNRNSVDFDATIGSYGVFLVADGGATLTTRNDPSLTANNTNNTVDVAEPFVLALLGLGIFGLIFARKRSSR